MKWNCGAPLRGFGGLITVLVFVSGFLLKGTSAQEKSEFRHREPIEPPEAVKAAKLEAEVRVPGGANGGDLVIRRIQPPKLQLTTRDRRKLADPEKEGDEEIGERVEGAKVTPHLETKWFIPTIELYPDGLSLVNWQAQASGKDRRGYEAWVAIDLSSIQGCGDFQVENTAYNLIGVTYTASEQRKRSVIVPNRENLPDGYLVTKGDAGDADAMEPLLSLIQLYAQQGEDIVADHRAILARSAARNNWEKENPEPVRNAEISFWPLKSTEYSTKASR